MHLSTTLMARIVTVFGITVGLATANNDQPFKMCTDNSCQNCPVSLTSTGTGYPQCVIYNSNDIFPNHKPPFAGSAGGGWVPFLNVFKPDPECQILVKTPANTDLPGCGDFIGHFAQPTCATLNLEETFMVQFCCGSGDCSAAGAPNTKRSGLPSGGMYLQHPNGTIIQPAKVGPMIPAKPEHGSFKPRGTNALLSRGAACDKNSWVADKGREDYTRPADGAQVVYSGIGSDQSVAITKERSVSFTESLMAGLSFEDIFSIGISFSLTDEMSNSKSITFKSEKGQSGDVVFTPDLRCSTGTGTCNGGSLHGEICTGFYGGDGMIAGRYTVAVSS